MANYSRLAFYAYAYRLKISTAKMLVWLRFHQHHKKKYIRVVSGERKPKRTMKTNFAPSTNLFETVKAAAKKPMLRKLRTGIPR